MKKMILISAISLVFLAVNAQRPSKSHGNEGNTEKKKSEMTGQRSVNSKTGSVEQKTDNSKNNPSSTTRTYSSKSRTDETVGSTRSYSGSGNDGRRSESDRSENQQNTLDQIVRNRTVVHKNLEYERNQNIDDRRAYSINGKQENNSRNYETERRAYHTPNRKPIHHEVVYNNKPRPIEYRRVHYPYRAPVNVHVIWTSRIYREYVILYPEFRYWNYPVGYRINTISAYDAGYYVGDVVNVFGKVLEAWYNRQSDEYFLFFGAPYPYHDFTIIVPGRQARQFSRHPEIFFEGSYLWATGLISTFDGKPEMVIRKSHQIHLY